MPLRTRQRQTSAESHSGGLRPDDRRSGTPQPETIERRTLLRWLGSTTVLALGGEIVAGCGTPQSEPARDLGGGSPFSFTPGSGAEPIFSGWGERTVDPQSLAAILNGWLLTVDGMVERPSSYSFPDLLAMPRSDQVTDFHCVEGWSVLDVPWNGVHMAALLDEARPAADATHVTFHTFGGAYNESLPLAVAREEKTILAYGIAGSTIPMKHGFPLRLVVPRLLGYKNAKYVARLELTDVPFAGYWVKAGYPYGGEVPARRLRSGKY